MKQGDRRAVRKKGAMMKRNAGAEASLLALGLLLLGAASSRADIIPQLQSTPTPSGQDYRWTYQVAMTSGERIGRGSYFTIYDFAGFIPGSNFQPINWVFSSAMTGKTPKGTNVVDNPKVPNLTWTYVGKATGGKASVNLGLFGALSIYGKATEGTFVADGRRYTPHQRGNGKAMFTTGSVPVPGPLVPEGASLSLLLPGLATFGLLLRRRSR